MVGGKIHEGNPEFRFDGWRFNDLPDHNFGVSANREKAVEDFCNLVNPPIGCFASVVPSVWHFRVLCELLIVSH